MAKVRGLRPPVVPTTTTVSWPKSDKFVASPKNDGVTATTLPAGVIKLTVDGGAGERPPGAVETRHAEQPEQGPLLAQRRRGAGSGAPGARERLGPVDQPLDRAVSH